MDLRRRGGRSIPDRLAPLVTRAILTPPRQHCSPLHELTRPRVSIRTAPRHQPFQGLRQPAALIAGAHGQSPLRRVCCPRTATTSSGSTDSSWRACLKVNSHNNVGIAECAFDTVRQCLHPATTVGSFGPGLADPDSILGAPIWAFHRAVAAAGRPRSSPAPARRRGWAGLFRPHEFSGEAH